MAPTLFARFPTAYTGAHVEGSTVTRVIAVDPGSPAERAGLHPGDSIGCTERSCVHVDDLNDRVAAMFAVLSAPAVAMPIFNGDELVGFALYGVHRDGTRLDPDEAALVEILAEAARQAYVRVENSRLRALVGV